MENNDKNTPIPQSCKTAVISSLWINGCDRTPIENLWFICYINQDRHVLKFNKYNNFWSSLDGRTYKPNEISRWLEA
jgi:hypothetical protein